MAVGAIHAVADVFGGVLLRVNEDRPAVLHQLAIGVGRQVLFLRWLEEVLTCALGGFLCQLGLVVHLDLGDRKSVVVGKRVSVRVVSGGRRYLKKKNKQE